MRKRQFFLVLLGVGVLIWMVAALFSRWGQPEYGGKRLSEWVVEYGSDSRLVAPKEAVRQIGTNAVPYLLKWIRYEPNKAMRRGRIEINKILSGVKREWRFMDKDQFRANGAAWALIELFPPTDQSLDELTRLMTDRKALFSAYGAMNVCAAYGSAGIPPLLSALTNGNPSHRGAIVDRFGLMGTNARPAIASLEHLLADPDGKLRESATNALLKIDPQALERGAP